MITVYNIKTGEEIEYLYLDDPHEALLCVWYQEERNNFDEETYGDIKYQIIPENEKVNVHGLSIGYWYAYLN